MILYSSETPGHLLETPCFGSESIFLLPKLVSFLDLLPKKSDADSEICVGIYRWYKIMSPKIEISVDSVGTTFNPLLPK